jgi:hypothetical protein
MLKSLGEKVLHMNVIEGIISDLPVFMILNQVEITQDPELM